jgi:hypothetical protein
MFDYITTIESEIDDAKLKLKMAIQHQQALKEDDILKKDKEMAELN